MKILRFTCVALLLSAPVFAQDELARKQAVEVLARVPFEKAMKGAPYSAETVVESSQTLADGNRITRKTTGAVYRDGEGRTRREEEGMVSTVTPRVSSRGPSISIVDPVGGFSYSLDPDRKIAFKTAIGGADAIYGKVYEATALQKKMDVEKQAAEEREKTTAAYGEMKPRSATPTARGGGGRGGVMVARGYAMADPNTPLEHKTIEGVAVEGRKTTTVIPAGQVGNEQPITVVSEEWRSPELNLLVLTRHSDPRTGESSYRLQNIIRAEPDQSLFIVPADYTVKETGIRRMEEVVRKH
jgi:hypothetical protein